MSFDIKIDGAKRLRRKLARMPKTLRKSLNKELNSVGAIISKEAKASIRRSSGKWEQYGSHWSSPPGTPPNEDTSELRRSIRLQRATLSNPEMRVVARAAYAAWLEFGTRYIEPRPFLGPVYRKFSPLATKRLKIVIKEWAIKESRSD